MHRTNSTANALNTGVARIDTGEGVVASVPLAPTAAQDTGWRSVPCTDNGTGNILIRRVGDRVRVRLNGLTVAAGSYAAYVATLPAGFVAADEEFFLAGNQTDVSNLHRMGIYGASRTKIAWVQTAEDGTLRPTVPLRGSWEFDTVDAWPATLPGTAV